MPLTTHVVQIEGLDRVYRRLEGLKGRALERRITATLAKALRSQVVPAMKAQAPVSPRGKTGRYPHRAGTLKRSIGVRAVRKRSGELVALKVGPRTSKGNPQTRAWYAGFAGRGTQPHLIRAGGLSAGAVRRFNRGGALALAFGGLVVKQVQHPGAKSNTGFVLAGASRERAVEQLLLAELVKSSPSPT